MNDRSEPAPDPSPAVKSGVRAYLDRWDRQISARCVVNPAGSARRTATMSVIRRVSQSGSYGVGWVVLFAVVVTALEGWVVACAAAGSVLGTLMINTVVKEIIRRPRPSATAFNDHPTTFSMPSAHTSMAVVGATVMTLVAPALWPLWWAWTCVLAISRIVLGMHFVGDVLVGALFGAALARWVVTPIFHALGVI